MRGTAFSFYIILFFCYGCSVAMPAVVQASPESKTRQANRFYREERYEEALKKYNEAQEDLPDSAIINFNKGNALYKKGDFDEASDSFTQALSTEDPRLEGYAYYNIGNAKYRLGNQTTGVDLQRAAGFYKESLAYYKRAIELDETDEDAKYNHEFVARELKLLEEKIRQQQATRNEDAEKEKDKEESEAQQTSEQRQQDKEGPEQRRAQDEGQGQAEEQQQVQQDQLEQELSPGEGGAKDQQVPTGQRPEDGLKKMSEKEARILLEGYKEEEVKGILMDRHKKDHYPDVAKDW